MAVIEIEEDPVGLGAVAQVIGSGTGGSVSDRASVVAEAVLDQPVSFWFEDLSRA